MTHRTCSTKGLAIGNLLLLGALAAWLPQQGVAASGPEPGDPSSNAAVLDPLPASLDRLFPPQSATPVYRDQMAELGFAYSAIFDDLEERDLDEARHSFESFRDRYRQVAGLVPEWRSRMPEAVLRPLESALRSGDVARSRDALLALRGTCAGCHNANMTRVQQVFHWGDFRRIEAIDPVAGRSVPFSALKWAMQDSFVGVMTDARQQQRARAQQHFREFAARFDALRRTCAGCHGDEVPKYAGAAIGNRITQLGLLLQAEPIVAAQVDVLTRQIDSQSCFKCHLVHLPAAKARAEHR